MAPPWERQSPPRAADSGPASTCRRGLTSVLKSPKLTHFYPKLIYRRGLACRAVEILASKKGTQPPLPTQPSPEMDTCPPANVSIQEAYISNPTQHWVMHDVVCNCNQQAVSMPSLTHTNPTSKRLWQLHILLSPPSMTLFQVLILRAPLPADESFYQHTHTHTHTQHWLPGSQRLSEVSLTPYKSPNYGSSSLITPLSEMLKSNRDPQITHLWYFKSDLENSVCFQLSLEMTGAFISPQAPQGTDSPSPSVCMGPTSTRCCKDNIHTQKHKVRFNMPLKCRQLLDHNFPTDFTS